MRKLKKLCSLALIATMIACTGSATFAATSSKKVPAYGTLRGTLDVKGNYKTTVTKNPDKAKLTISGSIENKAGKTLVKKQTIYSARGKKTLSGYWTSMPSNTYAVYGTHGVQNGTKYGAQAVYTSTHAK